MHFAAPPGPFGHIIAGLKRGQEIKIMPGFGYPESQETRTDIVLEVRQFSALTAGGIRLMCKDGEGVSTTGEILEEFEISDEAQKILDDLA